MGTKYKNIIDSIFESSGSGGSLAGGDWNLARLSCSLELSCCIFGEELVAAKTKLELLT